MHIYADICNIAQIVPVYFPNISTYMVYFFILVFFLNLEIDLVFMPNIISMYKEKSIFSPLIKSTRLFNYCHESLGDNLSHREKNAKDLHCIASEYNSSLLTFLKIFFFFLSFSMLFDLLPIVVLAGVIMVANLFQLLSLKYLNLTSISYIFNFSFIYPMVILSCYAYICLCVLECLYICHITDVTSKKKPCPCWIHI